MKKYIHAFDLLIEYMEYYDVYTIINKTFGVFDQKLFSIFLYGQNVNNLEKHVLISPKPY
jgi:hypothetical protein